MSKAPAPFTERGQQVIPVEKVQVLLPPSRRGEAVGIVEQRLDPPDAKFKRSEHMPNQIEWEFWLSERWRKVIGYVVTSFVVVALVWKLATVAETALPMLMR